MWHQGECKKCPAGFYCQNEGTSDDFTLCPYGYYCPEQSIDPIICPVGTYNPTKGAKSFEWCLDCPPGQYCRNIGTNETSGLCSAGFFCSKLSIEAEPLAKDLKEDPPRWGPCLAGHYCPEGTAYPFKCPIGTYNPVEKSTRIDDCLPCDPGHYGESTGLIVSTCTGKCSPGHICTGKATIPSPLRDTGAICREGTFCPAGSIVEIPC